MPKIRDLGISVIPATMRPPEIGGGAADIIYNMAQCERSASAPDCHPTEAPECRPTNRPCDPTPPHCAPSPCQGSPQCCPTEHQSVCSGKNADAVELPPDVIVQLKQQLQQQIGATLLN